MKNMHHKLTPELLAYKKKIIELAKNYGLTFHPIEFLLVAPEELNGIAAYGGFPTRIPHWTHGMAYEDLFKKYKHGAGKIYELVINTSPVYAYLLSTNTLVDQKLVMAHVCGHADFFYNNCWFKPTNKNMLNQMANNAGRVRRIIQKVGALEVEKFIDTCKSIDNLIDPYQPHVPRKNKIDEEEEYASKKPIPKLKAKSYMDRYINTDEYKQQQRDRLDQEVQRNKRFPKNPDRDILGFLVEHAPNLERWQRDILGMIREEAYYFAPQAMTKIQNEGWASYWHSKMMTLDLANDKDIIEYCERHSGVIATSGNQLNPYKLGIELYKDIEDRWNRGAHGPEYERCNSIEERENWDKKEGKGLEKIFQVRKTHNDLTFIDTFLTPEFCLKQKLFAFEQDKVYDSFMHIEKDFLKVKQKLLDMLTNAGQPIIRVVDGNYDNKGELLMEHIHEGADLDLDKAEKTLENVYTIWGRPVHIQTIDEDTAMFWSYNGDEHEKTLLV